MTVELVLLWSVYATLIMGLFLGPTGTGVGKTFKNNLPFLSARIERNLVTGSGFVNTPETGWNWKEPGRNWEEPP